MANPRLTADKIRLLCGHYQRYPDSELVNIVENWYNAEYAALDGEIEPYQVCEPCEDPEDSTAETIEDVVNLILGFVEGSPRRVARAAIGIICREARRQNVERTAPNVLPPAE